jgi:hypothetical protein
MMDDLTNKNQDKSCIILPHYLINKTDDAIIPLNMSLKDAKLLIKKLK